MQIFLLPMMVSIDKIESLNWERPRVCVIERSNNACRMEQFLDCITRNAMTEHDHRCTFKSPSLSCHRICSGSQVPVSFSFVDLDSSNANPANIGERDVRVQG